MLGISDEAVDRLIELVGTTGHVLVYVGLMCVCYMVWKLVFTFIQQVTTLIQQGQFYPYGSVPATIWVGSPGLDVNASPRSSTYARLSKDSSATLGGVTD